MSFAELAKQAFSFLGDAGFRLTESDSARLQYESPKAFVVVIWDDRSGELDVYFGLNPKKGEVRDSFSLTDILRMEDTDAPERKMPFQVSDKNNLREFINQLAEDSKNHAQAALDGDRMFFRRLKAFRNAQAQEYMWEMELRRVRVEAREAWDRRELDRLIGLYAPVESYLTSSEKAKLAYAKRHQSSR